MEPEQAFAEEAQERAILSREQSRERNERSSRKNGGVHTETEETNDSSSESSPLLVSGGDARMRRPYHRAGPSYVRAINEPWTGAHGQGDLPWHKKPSILWLLPGFFPFCIAFGGIMVPKTYLILDMICRDYFSDRGARDPSFVHAPVIIGQDNDQCRVPEVQALISYFNTYQDLISGIFSALVAPFLGALSDRIGRKKVIFAGSLGAFVNELITIYVGRNADKVSVYWLLLGAFFDGISGSFTVALALAFSYASDCTPPARRGVAFGYFHGTLFAGFALGPLVAGYMIKLAGGNILVPFYFAIACHTFFLFWLAVFVPESLSKERQMIAREQHAKVVADLKDKTNTWLDLIKRYNIFESLWTLRPTGDGTSPALRRNLFVLAAIDTMMFGVAMGTMRIIVNYLQFSFGWGPVESSLFMSACSGVRVTSLLVVLPILTKIFRPHDASQPKVHRGSDSLDIWIIRGAIIFDLVGYIGYAIAPTAAVTLVSGLITAVGGIGSPTLQSSLTKHMPARMTGQILGASGLLHALARVLAPMTFNMIYAHTVGTYKGFVFACLGATFVVIFILSWFLKKNVYLQDQIAVDQNAPPQVEITTVEEQETVK